MADGWLKTRYSLAGKKIWVAGHRGMVGAALMRRLDDENCVLLHASREELDLRLQADVQGFVQKHRPEIVIVAAAKVGGILANVTFPADFIYDNLMIEAHIIHAAHQAGVEKLLFLGSSCIYPKEAAQPVEEEALLTGALEPTNESYAIAKIAGVKLCQAYRAQHGCDFIAAMPCNLYGPGDLFDEQISHVIPALMMRAHAAKISGAQELGVWGSGKPMREFLYVDDLADALVFLLKNYSGDRPVNVGYGRDISIDALAHKIADMVGFQGRLVFDASKPDGTMRKLIDSTRIRNAGWAPQTGLRAGLQKTYDWFREQDEKRRAA